MLGMYKNIFLVGGFATYPSLQCFSDCLAGLTEHRRRGVKPPLAKGLLSDASSNSNSNSHDNVYGAVVVAVHCHCESSPGSSDECSTQRQAAAELWTKPISMSQ